MLQENVFVLTLIMKIQIKYANNAILFVKNAKILPIIVNCVTPINREN